VLALKYGFYPTNPYAPRVPHSGLPGFAVNPDGSISEKASDMPVSTHLFNARWRGSIRRLLDEAV